MPYLSNWKAIHICSAKITHPKMYFSSRTDIWYYKPMAKSIKTELHTGIPIYQNKQSITQQSIKTEFHIPVPVLQNNSNNTGTLLTNTTTQTSCMILSSSHQS